MTLCNPHTMITQAVASQVTALRLRFHSGAHRSRHAGHVGTSNTCLVARSTQRGTGKHRASVSAL
jgi:hypothetical protein